MLTLCILGIKPKDDENPEAWIEVLSPAVVMHFIAAEKAVVDLVVGVVQSFQFDFDLLVLLPDKVVRLEGRFFDEDYAVLILHPGLKNVFSVFSDGNRLMDEIHTLPPEVCAHAFKYL